MQRLIATLGIEPKNGECLTIEAREISRRKIPIEDIHVSYQNAGQFQLANDLTESYFKESYNSQMSMPIIFLIKINKVSAELFANSNIKSDAFALNLIASDFNNIIFVLTSTSWFFSNTGLSIALCKPEL